MRDSHLGTKYELDPMLRVYFWVLRNQGYNTKFLSSEGTEDILNIKCRFLDKEDRIKYNDNHSKIFKMLNWKQVTQYVAFTSNVQMYLTRLSNHCYWKQDFISHTCIIYWKKDSVI